MGKVAAVILVLSVVVCGMIGNDCVETCLENNSEAVCYNICRP